MAKITTEICKKKHENSGKITASIHTPKTDIFISIHEFILNTD